MLLLTWEKDSFAGYSEKYFKIKNYRETPGDTTRKRYDGIKAYTWHFTYCLQIFVFLPTTFTISSLFFVLLRKLNRHATVLVTVYFVSVKRILMSLKYGTDRSTCLSQGKVYSFSLKKKTKTNLYFPSNYIILVKA